MKSKTEFLLFNKDVIAGWKPLPNNYSIKVRDLSMSTISGCDMQPVKQKISGVIWAYHISTGQFLISQKQEQYSGCAHIQKNKPRIAVPTDTEAINDKFCFPCFSEAQNEIETPKLNKFTSNTIPYITGLNLTQYQVLDQSGNVAMQQHISESSQFFELSDQPSFDEYMRCEYQTPCADDALQLKRHLICQNDDPQLSDFKNGPRDLCFHSFIPIKHFRLICRDTQMRTTSPKSGSPIRGIFTPKNHHSAHRRLAPFSSLRRPHKFFTPRINYSVMPHYVQFSSCDGSPCNEGNPLAVAMPSDLPRAPKK